jgi:DnaK suppressor protein
MKRFLEPQQAATLRATLRGRLAALHEELRQDLLKSDDDRARLLADRVHDLEDESLADLIIDLDLAEIDRELEELRDVEAALGRMQQGSYGVCATCAGEVPYERLAAYPTAKRCQRCQRVREQTYAHKATPTL